MNSLDKKIDKAILECYQLLYENSTPKADFQKLMDEAPINDFGQKVIDYNSYEMEKSKFNEIIELTIKKHKCIKGDWMKRRFRNTILLGCSPKFFKKEI